MYGLQKPDLKTTRFDPNYIHDNRPIPHIRTTSLHDNIHITYIYKLARVPDVVIYKGYMHFFYISHTYLFYIYHTRVRITMKSERTLKREFLRGQEAKTKGEKSNYQ